MKINTQFTFRERWSNQPMSSVEFDCKSGLSPEAIKGIAIQTALKFQIDLEGANLSRSDLSGVNCDGGNFSKVDLSCSDMRNASFRGTSFDSANLRNSLFKGAILTKTSFQDANVEDVDFSEAKFVQNDDLVPKIKDIHQRIYQLSLDKDAFSMNCWSVATLNGIKRCRAGWVVHLSGEAGKKLEKKYGIETAAYAIYFESDTELKLLPNFYDTELDAREELLRLSVSSLRN